MRRGSGGRFAGAWSPTRLRGGGFRYADEYISVFTELQEKEDWDRVCPADFMEVRRIGQGRAGQGGAGRGGAGRGVAGQGRGEVGLDGQGSFTEVTAHFNPSLNKKTCHLSSVMDRMFFQ